MKSKVEDRLTQAEFCTVIQLSDPEKKYYNGSGLHLALFQDGILTELINLSNMAPVNEDTGIEADEILKNAVSWINARQDKGEIWLVMCSCYELCDPISLNRPESLAHLARLVSEMVMED